MLYVLSTVGNWLDSAVVRQPAKQQPLLQSDSQNSSLKRVARLKEADFFLVPGVTWMLAEKRQWNDEIFIGYL